MESFPFAGWRLNATHLADLGSPHVSSREFDYLLLWGQWERGTMNAQLAPCAPKREVHQGVSELGAHWT